MDLGLEDTKLGNPMALGPFCPFHRLYNRLLKGTLSTLCPERLR